MGKKHPHPGIDLIYADVPEHLPVPVVSPVEVPSWNKREDSYFESVFFFAFHNLTDEGAILIMHPKDRKIERALDVESKTFAFRVVRDWWGYNPMPMASILPHVKSVRPSFYIQNIIHNYWQRFLISLSCIYFCRLTTSTLRSSFGSLSFPDSDPGRWQKSTQVCPFFPTSRTMFSILRAKIPFVREKMVPRGVARERRIRPSSSVLLILSQTSEASSLTGALVQVSCC